MMRHIRANNCEFCVLRKARARVVDCLIKTVAAAGAYASHSLVVSRRRGWVDHGCEAACVGCYYGAFAEASLVSEIGYAEAGILISLFDVACVIFRFRDAPGNAKLLAVFLLSPHPTRRLVCSRRSASKARASLPMKASDIQTIRTRPGDEPRAPIDRREGTAKREPVLRGDVAFGDGKEAREPSFGGQQIVEIQIECVPSLQLIADGKQLGGSGSEEDQNSIAIASDFAVSAKAVNLCTINCAAKAAVDRSSAFHQGSVAVVGAFQKARPFASICKEVSQC